MFDFSAFDLLASPRILEALTRQKLVAFRQVRPPKFIGVFEDRFRDRGAEKQPSYITKMTRAYVDAKHVNRSRYSPHIGEKRGGGE